jgi:hypothetical protein
LDVKNSNVENYYPKDTLDYYLCIVRGKKAELIVSNPSDFILGDSVIVSTSRDSCFVYNQEKLKTKWKLYMVDYHTKGY